MIFLDFQKKPLSGYPMIFFLNMGRNSSSDRLIFLSLAFNIKKNRNEIHTNIGQLDDSLFCKCGRKRIKMLI
jgi:hypothetical protein